MTVVMRDDCGADGSNMCRVSSDGSSNDGRCNSSNPALAAVAVVGMMLDAVVVRAMRLQWCRRVGSGETVISDEAMKQRLR